MAGAQVSDPEMEEVSIVGKPDVEVLYFLWGQFDARAGKNNCPFRDGSRSVALWRDGREEYLRRSKSKP